MNADREAKSQAKVEADQVAKLETNLKNREATFGATFESKVVAEREA